jgi:hypothetical protein
MGAHHGGIGADRPQAAKIPHRRPPAIRPRSGPVVLPRRQPGPRCQVVRAKGTGSGRSRFRPDRFRRAAVNPGDWVQEGDRGRLRVQPAGNLSIEGGHVGAEFFRMLEQLAQQKALMGLTMLWHAHVGPETTRVPVSLVLDDAQNISDGFFDLLAEGRAEIAWEPVILGAAALAPQPHRAPVRATR